MSLGDDDDELPLENEVSRIVEDSSKLLMEVRESVDWKAVEHFFPASLYLKTLNFSKTPDLGVSQCSAFLNFLQNLAGVEVTK
jgi:hypothetical protein